MILLNISNIILHNCLNMNSFPTFKTSILYDIIYSNNSIPYSNLNINNLLFEYKKIICGILTLFHLDTKNDKAGINL